MIRTRLPTQGGETRRRISQLHQNRKRRKKRFSPPGHAATSIEKFSKITHMVAKRKSSYVLKRLEKGGETLHGELQQAAQEAAWEGATRLFSVAAHLAPTGSAERAHAAAANLHEGL